MKIYILPLFLTLFFSAFSASAKGPVITPTGKDTVHVYAHPGVATCYMETDHITFSVYDSVYGDLGGAVVFTSNLDCTNPGWYTIDFLVKNPDGDSVKYRRTVHVIKAVNKPQVDFTVSAEQVEIYNDVQAFGTADSGAYQYEWTFTSPSDLIYTSNVLNPRFTVDEIGPFTLCFRAKNMAGWSNWYCRNVDCIHPYEYYLGSNSLTFADSGILYGNNGPNLLYENNRNPVQESFTIRNNEPQAELVIKKLRLADTGDILKIYDGIYNDGKALHPSGGFTYGNFGTLPIKLISKTGNFYITFQSNSSGRDSGFTLEWKPAGDYKLRGLVYYDRDSNCKFDPKKDLPIPFYKIHLGNRVVSCNSVSGSFSLHTDSVRKTIYPEISKSWKVSCPAAGKDTWNYASPKTFAFAVKPANNNLMDLSAGIRSFYDGYSAKRGVITSLNLKAVNIGSVHADSFRCKLKTSRKVQGMKRLNGKYVSTDTTLEFVKYNLPVFAYTGDEINFTVPSTDTGTVRIDCNCFPLGSKADADSSGNFDSIVMRIVNAHDPNDKQVNVEKIFEKKNQTLKYFVRFQNTGTAPATDVIVRDTLSNLLDTNTIELINPSHSGFMERNGYALAFKFLGINLQDSNHNEPLSHGYFYYSVNPVTDIAQNQPIKNTAYIYFDAEKPVVTNTTINWWATYPAIDLNTADTICHQINTAYLSTLPTAKDKYYSQNDISIVKKGNVNAQVEGIYPEEYTATNAAGNSSKKTRYVHVKSCVNMVHLYSQDNIVVSPMPVSDRIHIKLLPENVLYWTLKLYNTQGMLIYSSLKKAQMGEVEYMLSNIPVGIYFMEIQSEDGHNKFRRNLVIQQ